MVANIKQKKACFISKKNKNKNKNKNHDRSFLSAENYS